MKVEFYQIDAFADSVFTGNPAVVIILDAWLEEPIMQAIAAEMNVSETSFVVKKGSSYRIRWFTPCAEVKLCGHATLATAHVLYEHKNVAKDPIIFQSLSGQLQASIDTNSICLNFPRKTLTPVKLETSWINAMGGAPLAAYAGDDLVLEYSDASEIEILSPNMSDLKTIPYRGVCATAPGNGNGFDFVCRFFAPAIGVDEDPVTGSLFTELAPYYADRFGKTEFIARQVSKRGGNVHLRLKDDRVFISGKAITAMHGTLFLP